MYDTIWVHDNRYVVVIIIYESNKSIAIIIKVVVSVKFILMIINLTSNNLIKKHNVNRLVKISYFLKKLWLATINILNYDLQWE